MALDMQQELRRCVTVAQSIISVLPPSTSAPCPPLDSNSRDILHTVVASGIPRIHDSRIPDVLALKLHALTEEHFRQACFAFGASYSNVGGSALQRRLLGLQTTYTTLYERKILEATKTLPKSRPQQKQPFANEVLLYAFEQSQSPSRREREVLASLTGMTVEQVRVWFQNRRSRTKKKAPELQARPALQMEDLLNRVRTARKAAVTAERAADCDFDDADSGYFSGSDDGRPPAAIRVPACREFKTLTAEATTQRSYPAPYTPQGPSPPPEFEMPIWVRTPTTRAPVHHSAMTMTVDELSRSMARLGLRHRRETTRTASVDVSHSLGSTSSPSSPPAPTQPKPVKRSARKDPRTGRKIAGGRCAASGSLEIASSHPPPELYPPQSSATSGAPTGPSGSTPRKKAGPPRRKPTGKALSRQVSDVSTTSSLSNSSRSTSSASDFSFGTVDSDFSMTSVDSMPPPASCDQGEMQGQAGADVTLALLCGPQVLAAQHEHSSHIPVFDFTTASCDLSLVVEPAPGAGPSSDVPYLSQLLCDTQSQPLQYSTAVSSVPAPDQQSFDAGAAVMGTVLDFSSAVLPTLDALLSDDGALYSSLLQSQQDMLIALAPPQPHQFLWRDTGLLTPGLA